MRDWPAENGAHPDLHAAELPANLSRLTLKHSKSRRASAPFTVARCARSVRPKVVWSIG